MKKQGLQTIIVCMPLMLLVACKDLDLFELERPISKLADSLKEAQTIEEVLLFCDRFESTHRTRPPMCTIPLAKPLVSTANLNVRASGSLRANIITTISAGEKVRLVDYQGVWLDVLVWPNGPKEQPIRGWVHSGYIEPLGVLEGREYYINSATHALRFFWVSSNVLISLSVLLVLFAIEIAIAGSADNPKVAGFILLVINCVIFLFLNLNEFWRIGIGLELILFVILVAIPSFVLGAIANVIAQQQ